jgi:hypothetical protein
MQIPSRPSSAHGVGAQRYSEQRTARRERQHERVTSGSFDWIVR